MSKRELKQRIRLMYLLLVFPIVLVACGVAAGGPSHPGSIMAFLTNPTVEAIAGAFIAGLSAMLPYIQLRLKAMPTSESVKITGPLGFLLDCLTWYQKDILKVAQLVNLTLDTGSGEKITAKVQAGTTTIAGAAVGPTTNAPQPGAVEVTAKPAPGS